MIGLGTEEGDLSTGAARALESVPRVIARTERMPCYSVAERYGATTLDHIFESSRNYDTLNKKLAAAVLSAAKESDVAYCVDGAVCEDAACRLILAKRKDAVVFEGVSKAARAASLAGLGGAFFSVSAYDVGSLKSARAAVVYDIDGEYAAAEVKSRLSELFGEELPCTFVRGGGAKRIKVYEIDRQKEYDATCAVAVEAPGFLHRERYDYADLLEMVRMLRAPGGCPWDRAQTPATIKQNMIEEAYELVDAINRDDDDGIEEETGDVLLQAAFHTVLKGEQGAFSDEDVTTRVVKKLIFRHSHIFGKDRAADENDALSVWEKNKKQEKHMSTFGEAVEAVPRNFPACMRAQKVQKRAAKAGLDFLSSISAAEKLNHDMESCINALIGGDKPAADSACGEILFTAVGLCRLAGADCEQALSDATERFVARFVKAEELAVKDGKNVSDFSELDWNWYMLQAENALKNH